MLKSNKRLKKIQATLIFLIVCSSLAFGAQLVIDQVGVYTTPQLMIQAIDDNFDELYSWIATGLQQSDVDDTPVNDVTTAPVSSNWAYDHTAAADPHPGYQLEPSEGAFADGDKTKLDGIEVGATAINLASPGEIGGTTPAPVNSTNISIVPIAFASLPGSPNDGDIYTINNASDACTVDGGGTTTIIVAYQDGTWVSQSCSGSGTPVTIGTSNGLSLDGQEVSLAAATNSTPGAATAAQVTELERLSAALPAGTDGNWGIESNTNTSDTPSYTPESGKSYLYPGPSGWYYSIGTGTPQLIGAGSMPTGTGVPYLSSGSWGTTLGLNTAMGGTPSDSNLLTEKAVDDAIQAAVGGYVATPPTYSDEVCTPGQYALSEYYRWDCVASGNWNRTALTDWSNPAPVTYTLTITPPSNGTITCSDADLSQAIICGTDGSTCTATAASGASITGITGTADSGYDWSAWTGDISGSAYNDGSVTMSADRTGSATFGESGVSWNVHDSNSSTGVNSVTASNVAAGDVVLVAISGNISQYDALTVSDGTSSLNVGTAVGYGGNYRVQFAYLLSSVATGTVTYTMTNEYSTFTSNTMTVYVITPAASVAVDTSVSTATTSHGGVTSSSTDSFTTGHANEIIFGIHQFTNSAPGITANTINSIAVTGSTDQTNSALSSAIRTSYGIFDSTFTGNMAWAWTTECNGAFNVIGFYQ